MKHFLIVIILFFGLSTVNAQDCSEPIMQKYKKVMNSAFAKDYKDCPVIIEAEYLKEGYMKNYRKPKKIKKMYFFQCIAIDGETKSAAITNEKIGDFFVIDKKMADKVIDFEKGQKLKITGTTFTQNYFGTELSTFFKVQKVEKMN